MAVLTNVELDHHATFASLAELRAAFRAFLGRVHTAIVVWDRPELLELRGVLMSSKKAAYARARVRARSTPLWKSDRQPRHLNARRSSPTTIKDPRSCPTTPPRSS